VRFAPSESPHHAHPQREGRCNLAGTRPRGRLSCPIELSSAARRSVLPTGTARSLTFAVKKEARLRSAFSVRPSKRRVSGIGLHHRTRFIARFRIGPALCSSHPPAPLKLEGTQ
jgi:hypothetical protein